MTYKSEKKLSSWKQCFLPFNELNFISNDVVQNEENLNYSVLSQGHKKQ